MYAHRTYRVRDSSGSRQVGAYVVSSSYSWILALPVSRRFCDAMIQIRKEVDDIISGKQPKDNNLLKNAPHPLSAIVVSDKEWNRCVLISCHGCGNSWRATAHILGRRLFILWSGYERRNFGRQFPVLTMVSTQFIHFVVPSADHCVEAFGDLNLVVSFRVSILPGFCC